MPDPGLHIWTVTRTDEVDHGENAQHVIIAKDTHAARIIAGRAAHGENGIVWAMDSTTVVHIGVADDDSGPGIVVTEMLGE
jgi:hypothetical protein